MISRYKNIKVEKWRSVLFILLSGVIILFNFSFKTSLKAEDNSNTININNVVIKHNKIRLESNLAKLSSSKLLNISALNKAKEMIKNSCWSHYCPDGKSPWEFFDSSGYEYTFAGENLAEGFNNVNIMMETWMNSETHRENILNQNFNEIGVGIINDAFQGNPNNILVVVHFGKREVIKNEPYIKITDPQNSSVIGSKDIEVNGVVNDINQINLNIDDKFDQIGEIEDGAFTFRVKELNSGMHSILVSGNDDFGTFIESNQIIVQVDNTIIDKEPINSSLDNNNAILGETQEQTSQVYVSPDTKNNVNLIFILIIGIIFFVDFLVLSRTKILDQKRSFSHYHFILLLITFLALSFGGFNGNIINGIGI